MIMWGKVGIYKITSPSGKVYIGQSWDIGNRRSCYKTKCFEKQHRLYNSIRKYGFENHKFEMIYELPKDITQEVLDNYEILYWQLYKDCGIEMLNLKYPGKGGKHTEESKKRMSEVKRSKNLKRPEMIIRNKQMILSDESRAKMRAAKIGNKNRLGGNKYTEKLIN